MTLTTENWLICYHCPKKQAKHFSGLFKRFFVYELVTRTGQRDRRKQTDEQKA